MSSDFAVCPCHRHRDLRESGLKEISVLERCGYLLLLVKIINITYHYLIVKSVIFYEFHIISLVYFIWFPAFNNNSDNIFAKTQDIWIVTRWQFDDTSDIKTFQNTFSENLLNIQYLHMNIVSNTYSYELSIGYKQ